MATPTTVKYIGLLTGRWLDQPTMAYASFDFDADLPGSFPTYPTILAAMIEANQRGANTGTKLGELDLAQSSLLFLLIADDYSAISEAPANLSDPSYVWSAP